MNTAELRTAVTRMSDDDYAKLIEDFGGELGNRETLVESFVHHPDFERRLCYLLKLPTEEEKTLQAMVDTATSAKASAIYAAIAGAIALVSLLVNVYILASTH